MKIYLDDLRPTPEGWTGAKNFIEFKKNLEDALISGEKIEAISFDNDLGEGEIEGWEAVKWLNETHPEIYISSPELTAHSANPNGREAIEHHLQVARERPQELIDAKNRSYPFGEIEK